MSSRSVSLRRDLLSATALAAARVLSWAAVFALVYRTLGREAFAALALLRGTTALVRLLGLGLGPALVHTLARAGDDRPVLVAAAGLAAGGFVAALGVAAAYGLLAGTLHAADVPGLGWCAAWLCVGVGLRNLAETIGGTLQARGRLAADNTIAAGGELLWPTLTFALGGSLAWVGFAFVLAESVALAGKLVRSHAPTGHRRTARTTDGEFARCSYAPLGHGYLLTQGGFVTLALVADFLYAPIDYVLLDRLVSPEAVATYAPAVQVDAVLVTLGVTLAGVALPRAAAGAAADAWRGYVRGTLALAGLLAGLAGLAYLAAPAAFTLWLGEPLPGSVALLPLVLVNTVVGGSGAVGRSVLLGLGHARALAASVLVAGAANAAISLTLVAAFGLGITGVVLGTLAVAVGRAALWQPWYVRRVTRSG